VNSHTKQIATVQENTRLLDSAVERIEKKLDKLIDTK
jgi:hypothetical protein